MLIPYNRVSAGGGAIGGAYKSGSWIRPFNNSIGTFVAANGDMRCAPVIIPVKCSLTTICAEVTGAGTAGALVRLGIYLDNQGVPDGLLIDAGTIDGTSATVQNKVFTATPIPAGRYWLAAVTQGTPATAPTMRSVNGHGFPILFSTNANATAQVGAGYQLTGTTGALPAFWGNTLTVVASIQSMGVLLP